MGQDKSDARYRKISLPEEMAIDKRAARAERAERLKQARVAAGFDGYGAVVKAAQAAHVNLETYRSHEQNRNGYGVDEARVYAKTFKTTVSWLLDGEGQQQAPEPEIVYDTPTATVVGEVAAGRYLSTEFHDETKWDPVPFVPGRYANLEQFAYRVVGPSMDLKHISDGDFIICVPYFEARPAPQDNDIVVVENVRNRTIERTCKELVITKNTYELWPRSSSTVHSEPLVIPKSSAVDGQPWLDETGLNAVIIVGLVIGRFRPFGNSY